MRLQLKIADLLKALSVVSIVTPKALSSQSGGGYLFRAVRMADGALQCHIYSRDSSEIVRATITPMEVDFDPAPDGTVVDSGSFIAPVVCMSQMSYLKPEATIEFTSEVKAQAKGAAYVLSYQVSTGAHQSFPTFDPKNIGTVDADYEAVKAATPNPTTFPVGMFRDAIGMSKGFLSDPKASKGDEEHLKTLQVFDGTQEAWAKGNGTLFASNGVTNFYFYSPAFENNGVAIHGSHLDRFVSFLGKCTGSVRLLHSKNMSFIEQTSVDGVGAIFAWARHDKVHPKYGYYALKRDTYILRVKKDDFLQALYLNRLRLEGKRDKVSLAYLCADDLATHRSLFVQIPDGDPKDKSDPIVTICTDPDLRAEDRDFKYNVNVNQLIALITDVKGYDVFLHVAPMEVEGRKPGALFRTIDEFWMTGDGKVLPGVALKDESGNEKAPEGGGFKCRVTRFMPSKD